MDEIRPGNIVHIAVMCFVDRAGDVARDRFDMDAFCEPQTERRRDRLAYPMDGARALLGGGRILEAGTPYLV